MRRNGLRLLQLINQLLDLSRLDSGKMTIQVRPLDLVPLTRALVMSVHLACGAKSSPHLRPRGRTTCRFVDQDKFEKILTNLLSNAFKFTGDGGEIRVLLRRPTKRQDGGWNSRLRTPGSGSLRKDREDLRPLLPGGYARLCKKVEAQGSDWHSQKN